MTKNQVVQRRVTGVTEKKKKRPSVTASSRLVTARSRLLLLPSLNALFHPCPLLADPPLVRCSRRREEVAHWKKTAEEGDHGTIARLQVPQTP